MMMIMIIIIIIATFLKHKIHSVHRDAMYHVVYVSAIAIYMNKNTSNR